MRNLAKKMFSEEDLKSISAAVTAAEKSTIGEIRVDIRQKRKWRERTLTLEQIARREFHELGMNRTAERTGILIFLLLEDRAFYILADEGIHGKVEENTWQKIAAGMADHFTRKNFRHGIIHGVQEVGSVLTRHFPDAGKGKNELPDDVVVR
jgi:uncharacterized membrane protein